MRASFTWLSGRYSTKRNGPVPIIGACPAGLEHSSSGMITNGARGLLIASSSPGNTRLSFSTSVLESGVSYAATGFSTSADPPTRA